jgi:hypothetical protein
VVSDGQIVSQTGRVNISLISPLLVVPEGLRDMCSSSSSSSSSSGNIEQCNTPYYILQHNAPNRLPIHVAFAYSSQWYTDSFRLQNTTVNTTINALIGSSRSVSNWSSNIYDSWSVSQSSSSSSSSSSTLSYYIYENYLIYDLSDTYASYKSLEECMSYSLPMYTFNGTLRDVWKKGKLGCMKSILIDAKMYHTDNNSIQQPITITSQNRSYLTLNTNDPTEINTEQLRVYYYNENEKEEEEESRSYVSVRMDSSDSFSTNLEIFIEQNTPYFFTGFLLIDPDESSDVVRCVIKSYSGQITLNMVNPSDIKGSTSNRLYFTDKILCRSNPHWMCVGDGYSDR